MPGLAPQRAEAEADLVIDVPPLVTRPKAATVGVGRQVILRPSLQKRYVELTEPTLDDQRIDLERLSDAMDDLDLRVDAGVLRRLPRVLRASGFRVTCVVSDDFLIDVEPGDTTGRLHAIAFDLGTTTVVATLLDLATVCLQCAVDAQPPAALRRRRDHPARRRCSIPRCSTASATWPVDDAGARRGGARRRHRAR